MPLAGLSDWRETSWVTGPRAQLGGGETVRVEVEGRVPAELPTSPWEGIGGRARRWRGALTWPRAAERRSLRCRRYQSGYQLPLPRDAGWHLACQRPAGGPRAQKPERQRTANPGAGLGMGAKKAAWLPEPSPTPPKPCSSCLSLCWGILGFDRADGGGSVSRGEMQRLRCSFWL